MAVTFGNTTYDVSSSSFSHNNNGDCLVVCSSSNTSAITGVTYNGVAMTQVGTAQNFATFARDLQVWILVNPTAGSNTVAWTGGGANAYFGCISISGVDQTTPYTGLTTASGTSSTPSISVTTTVDNAFPLSFGFYPNTPTAGTDTTLHLNVVGAALYCFKKTTAKTPTGAFSVAATMTSAAWILKGFGINPVPPPNTTNFFAMM